MTAREIIEKIVKESNKQIMEDEFKLLDVLHHFTSGLKALAAEMSYGGVDEMRQACGGAGFLTASGISALWEDVAPYSTYEGVNVIMFQQSSRYLLKQAAKIAKGKKCVSYFEYLNEMPNIMNLKSTASTVDEFLSWDHLVKTMATRSLVLVAQTSKLLTESTQSSKTKTNELFALEVQKMAKTHLCYILFIMTKSRIETYPFVDAKVRIPLDILAKIFAVKQILKDPQSLYECGYFGRGSGQLIDAAYKKLLVDMRPHMIPFVEYSPNYLHGIVSTIGNSHGDIYETQLQVAKNSRLNKTEVPPYYEKYMKPTMNMRKPKL